MVDHNLSLPHDHLQLPASAALRALRRRRLMLVALTVAAADCALARVVQASSGDPHGAWWSTIQRLREEADMLDDDAADVLFARVDQLERLVALTPARTCAGVQAQLRMALHDLELGDISDVAVIGLRQAVTAMGSMTG